MRFSHTASTSWLPYPPKPHSDPGHNTNVTPAVQLATLSLSGIQTGIYGMGDGQSNKDAEDHGLYCQSLVHLLRSGE